jgi:hypothetical protein
LRVAASQLATVGCVDGEQCLSTLVDVVLSMADGGSPNMAVAALCDAKDICRGLQGTLAVIGHKQINKLLNVVHLLLDAERDVKEHARPALHEMEQYDDIYTYPGTDRLMNEIAAIMSDKEHDEEARDEYRRAEVHLHEDKATKWAKRERAAAELASMEEATRKREAARNMQNEMARYAGAEALPYPSHDGWLQVVVQGKWRDRWVSLQDNTLTVRSHPRDQIIKVL